MNVTELSMNVTELSMKISMRLAFVFLMSLSSLSCAVRDSRMGDFKLDRNLKQSKNYQTFISMPIVAVPARPVVLNLIPDKTGIDPFNFYISKNQSELHEKINSNTRIYIKILDTHLHKSVGVCEWLSCNEEMKIRRHNSVNTLNPHALVITTNRKIPPHAFLTFIYVRSVPQTGRP